MIPIAITSKDIAKICGVSQGTVDRALHNRPGINAATKKKILETAAMAGYRPHHVASSLVKGQTMTLGIILFDLYNRFFAEIAGAIEESAKKQGYFVYLTLTRKSRHEERACIEHLVSRRVDGLILCSVQQGDDYQDYLASLRVPIVTIGNRVSEAFPFVGIDDYAAMREATERVAARGYTRIVYISPPLQMHGKTNLYAQERRLEGFVDALKGYGRSVESWIVDTSDYLRKLDYIQFGRDPRTAFLCSSDLYALEVLNYLRTRRVRIPEDVGLMGFDNIDTLKYIRPALSTVAYPLQELGAQSVELLLDIIHGRINPVDVILYHRIVEGETL